MRFILTTRKKHFKIYFLNTAHIINTIASQVHLYKFKAVSIFILENKTNNKLRKWFFACLWCTYLKRKSLSLWRHPKKSHVSPKVASRFASRSFSLSGQNNNAKLNNVSIKWKVITHILNTKHFFKKSFLKAFLKSFRFSCWYL